MKQSRRPLLEHVYSPQGLGQQLRDLDRRWNRIERAPVKHPIIVVKPKLKKLIQPTKRVIVEETCAWRPADPVGNLKYPYYFGALWWWQEWSEEPIRSFPAPSGPHGAGSHTGNETQTFPYGIQDLEIVGSHFEHWTDTPPDIWHPHPSPTIGEWPPWPMYLDAGFTFFRQTGSTPRVWLNEDHTEFTVPSTWELLRSTPINWDTIDFESFIDINADVSWSSIGSTSHDIRVSITQQVEAESCNLLVLHKENPAGPSTSSEVTNESVKWGTNASISSVDWALGSYDAVVRVGDSTTSTLDKSWNSLGTGFYPFEYVDGLILGGYRVKDA